MFLEDFRERVRRVAQERKGEPVYNGSLEHATIIIENMFEHASNNIDILSGSLNARVYGTYDVIKNARRFLASPSNTLRVILDDAEEVDLRGHPFFDAVESFTNVELKRIGPAWQDDYDFHFLVMDGDSYRFEPDKTEHSAIAAFGDRKGGESMTKLFQMMWDGGETMTRPSHSKSM